MRRAFYGSDRRTTSGLSIILVVVILAGLSAAGLLDASLVVDVPHRLLPPSAAHWFGTDAFGRDVFSAILAGSRTTLLIAFAAVTAGAGIGVPLGLYAAVRGGFVDEALTRVNDVLFAFPSLLLAVLFAAALGPGFLATVLAIGLFNVPVFARVARAVGLSLVSHDFVRAARLAGAGPVGIAVKHLLPNAVAVVGAQIAIQLSLAVVAEAGLSYVGLGVQPPAPSWGRMLGDAQTYFHTAPWLAIFPGLAIALTVLAFTLLGEGLGRAVPERRNDP